MTDLGTLGNDPCGRAFSINLSGQVVGATDPCNGEFTHAFLWENGGPIIDLNTLVLHGSGLMVRDGDYINDRGEIAGRGVLPNGDVHAVLLIPCDEQHHGIEGCDYSLVDATAATQSPAPRYLPSETQRTPQSRRTNRYHIPGLPSPSR
jgi:probable HAF family extracellular repeat protein